MVAGAGVALVVYHKSRGEGRRLWCAGFRNSLRSGLWLVRTNSPHSADWHKRTVESHSSSGPERSEAW